MLNKIVNYANDLKFQRTWCTDPIRGNLSSVLYIRVARREGRVVKYCITLTVRVVVDVDSKAAAAAVAAAAAAFLL